MLTVQAFAGASRAEMVFDDDIACTVREFSPQIAILSAAIFLEVFSAFGSGYKRNKLPRRQAAAQNNKSSPPPKAGEMKKLRLRRGE